MMKSIDDKELETFLQSEAPTPKTGAAAVRVAGGVVGGSSGYSFGGPIGAAIGMAIGFTAPAVTYMVARYGRN